MYTYPVLLIFFFAAAGMFVNTSMVWTLLPYMQSTGYTSTTLYIRLSAIPVLIPALSYSLLGFLSARVGAALTMAYTHSAVAVGVLLVLCLPQYLPMLVTGTVLHSVVEGVRIVRVAAISELVAPERRTAALAVHFLMSPVGAVFGPLVWLVVDRYGLYYAISIAFMTGVAGLAWTSREHLDVDRHGACVSHSESERNCELGINSTNVTTVGYGAVPPADGTVSPNIKDKTVTSHNNKPLQQQHNETQADERGWTRDDVLVLLWFTCCILPVRVSLSLQMATFQPALIERFGWSADSVASAYLIVAIASTIPPLIVAVLSTHMSDRSIAALGVLLKLIGAVIYLPLFPTASSSSTLPNQFALHPWQIVVGFVLAVKATAFFMPCLQSVLTKRVAGRARRVEMMGVVWMVSNGTAAVVQISAADVLMSLLGTWKYAIVVLPYCVSGVMVMWGRSWGYVAPIREVMKT